MTRTAIRRRKKQPYNPVHDRRAQDLLRNAQVTPVEVDDPYEDGGKIVVLRSTRDDPLADMLSRGYITQCEFETGRHWQRAYENAEIGGVAAIDPGKEAVDGGRMRDVLTDRQVKATRELASARAALGDAGNYLIIQVLGTKMTLDRVAQEKHWGKPGEAQYKYVRRRFHECLSTLSVLFGYAMPHTR